jgi:A/G-specific adenine glycosylase
MLPESKSQLRRRLFAWYAKHARDLPWRRSTDPYHVWVSEIMLQQTQVETVRRYFERFVAELPTIADLAAADENRLLRLWEGMGYYRRARQLQAAAAAVVEHHQGRLPCDVPSLQTLPGIGRYTAGAIASIAFDLRAPILEANTIRLLSRLIGYRGDPSKAAGKKLLWQTAEDILPRKNISQFNQALMELGSLVCTPAEPSCSACPLRRMCVAHLQGLVDQIPATKAKPESTQLHEAAVVVRRHGDLLLRKCAREERWAGLWDVPRFSIASSGPLFADPELIAKVRELTGITCSPATHLRTIKHGVTRFRITLDCYQATYQSGRLLATTASPVRWVPAASVSEYPLSTTGRKIVDMAVGC